MEMLEAIDQALQTIWGDATGDDALAVQEFLLANMSAGDATLFRDEVATRRKREYMRTYMQSRRQALLVEKEAKA